MQASSDIVLLSSAARTATTTTSPQQNLKARGVLLVLNVTIASGAGGLTLRIQYKDPVSGNWGNLNSAPTTITAAAQLLYVLYPGVTATNGNAQQVVSFPLPRDWRVSITHGDGSSYTYSLAAVLLP